MLPTLHETFSEYNTKRTRLLIVYAILILSTLVLYIMRTFGFFIISLKISLRLHDRLFNGIIRACMHFFTTNPSGRILNRFSSDISDLDVSLPQAMLESLQVSDWFLYWQRFIHPPALLAVHHKCSCRPGYCSNCKLLAFNTSTHCSVIT